MGASMRGPMFALAALCLAIGLGAGAAVRIMEPAVAMLTGSAAAVSGRAPVQWLFPIACGAVLLLLLASIGGLALLRRRLLAGRPIRRTVTWDCGFAVPAPSMQYTAMGFAQPLTHGAAAILRPQVASRPPEGIFPAAASHRSETPDIARERLFDPLFRTGTKLLGRLRWLQQGRVHWYVLYIVVVLVVLLAWALTS